MQEIWKDVIGYEGRYQVSNLGNVKSTNYLGTKKAKILTPINHHTGYQFVHLGTKIKFIHVIVAEAFIPNPQCKRCVNHIDGNKHNNNLLNLEWVTHKENNAHAIRTGLRDPHKNNAKSGEEKPNSKTIIQYTKDGILVKKWDCISSAAREIGCNPSQIINNAVGRNKTCHGYIWRYETEDSLNHF